VAELDTFLRDLSSGDPVPGGGSVAALEVSLGAALLVMVSNLTLGRKKYADVQAPVSEIRERAAGLRDRAAALVQQDIDAYARVAEAMALPRDSDEQKAERRDRLQAALKEAARPPLETMRLATEVLGLAGELAGIGNPSAISDVGTAALSARAGYHAGRLNVEINLAAVRDPVWVERMRSELDALADADSAESSTMARVLSAIRGEAG
jgi:formiminotetrahydrofolate cyclodeaminase